MILMMKTEEEGAGIGGGERRRRSISEKKGREEEHCEQEGEGIGRVGGWSSLINSNLNKTRNV